MVIEPPGEDPIAWSLEVLSAAIKFEMYTPFNPAIAFLKFFPTYEQMNKDS